MPAEFAVTCLPFMQSLFGTQSVPLQDGLQIVGIGEVFFSLVEIEKQMRLAFRNRG